MGLLKLGTDEENDDEKDEGEERNHFEGHAQLMKKFFELKTPYENATSKICAACGRSATGSSHSGYMLELCEEHHRRRLKGDLFYIWVEG